MSKYEIVPDDSSPLMETLVIYYECGHTDKYAFGKGFAQHSLDEYCAKVKCLSCHIKDKIKRDSARQLMSENIN